MPTELDRLSERAARARQPEEPAGEDGMGPGMVRAVHSYREEAIRNRIMPTQTFDSKKEPIMNPKEARPMMTVDEYLAFERASAERHVYIDGQLFPVHEVTPLPGDSSSHDRIRANLIMAMETLLGASAYAAIMTDNRVRTGPTTDGSDLIGSTSCPDALVVFGEPEHRISARRLILNPTAIFEVLSPLTEAFDRGDKLHRYRKWNPTLQDYVLISQHASIVERFSRQSDENWEYQAFPGIDATADVPSIRCELKLAELYDRVTSDERGTRLPLLPRRLDEHIRRAAPPRAARAVPRYFFSAFLRLILLESSDHFGRPDEARRRASVETR